MSDTDYDALAADEWKVLEMEDYGNDVSFTRRLSHRFVLTWDGGKHHTIGRPLAVAALALYNEDYGFTLTDLESVRRLCGAYPELNAVAWKIALLTRPNHA